MNRRIATIVVGIGLSSSAYAVEWSMNTTLRETLELSDNPFQRGTAAAGVGSYSSYLGHITGQTKRSRFDFDADFTYKKYWGPAADVGGSLAETTDNGLKLHYEMLGKTPGDKNTFDAIWRRRNAALAILDDLGVPSNATGDIHTTTVQGGIERALTPTDFWTWNSRATSTNYVPSSGGVQYYDVTTTSTFRHQSNRTSALTGLTEFEWLKYDNTTQTNIMIIRYMAGFNIQPYKNVSFVASGGAATVIIEQGEIPLVVNPFATVPSSAVASGFIGNATLTYKFWPTTELTLVASRTIAPSVIGALTTRETVGASIRHTINPQSSLTTRVDLTRQKLVNGQTDFITTSATYSKTLARDWNFDLTYRYTHRSATTGTTNITFDPITGQLILLNGTNTDSATSNTIFFVLSKRFVHLPKRT